MNTETIGLQPLPTVLLQTPAEMDFNHRLKEIYQDMCHLLDVYKPEQMAVEKLFFTTNQKTAIDVAQARGVIMLSAAERDIPAFEYTPLQVKQSVVGYGKAIKAQVMDMTKRLLNLEKCPNRTIRQTHWQLQSVMLIPVR